MAGREEGERNHKDTKITKETRREREAPAETMIRKEKPESLNMSSCFCELMVTKPSSK